MMAVLSNTELDALNHIVINGLPKHTRYLGIVNNAPLFTVPMSASDNQKIRDINEGRVILSTTPGRAADRVRHARQASADRNYRKALRAAQEETGFRVSFLTPHFVGSTASAPDRDELHKIRKSATSKSNNIPAPPLAILETPSKPRIIKAKAKAKPKRKVQPGVHLLDYQRGTSHTARDKARKAKRPGRRRSHSGRFYTETRKNRSDLSGNI